MSPSTPPRPLDITALFPELADRAATAVRLHPAPGSPGSFESSVAGPWLWPSGEPWPSCPAVDHSGTPTARRPADIRAERVLVEAVRTRGRISGARGVTAEEKARWREYLLEWSPAWLKENAFWPLLPVLQIHAYQVPWFPLPHGAEVLQVLWCPCQHDEFEARPFNGYDGAPWVQVRYHGEGTGPARFTPPEPLVIGAVGLLPERCVLRPESVVEYPRLAALDRSLAGRIRAWESAGSDRDGDRRAPHDYDRDHATAPGWKLGGHPEWHAGRPSDPPAAPIRCGCGAAMRFLVAIPSSEWDEDSRSWAPPEELALAGPEEQGGCPTAVTVGDRRRLQVFVCPDSPDHPVHSEVVR